MTRQGKALFKERKKSVNFGKIKHFGTEASLDFDLYQLLPSQRFFKKFGVAYSYIHQKKVDNQGYVSKYALEYLKNKMVKDIKQDYRLIGKWEW